MPVYHRGVCGSLKVNLRPSVIIGGHLADTLKVNLSDPSITGRLLGLLYSSAFACLLNELFRCGKKQL